MSCNNGNCSSFGLEQEKYLLQAFSSEKTLAPRALIMARIQAPRFYVRARQFDSGVFKKIWFNKHSWSHQKAIETIWHSMAMKVFLQAPHQRP